MNNRRSSGLLVAASCIFVALGFLAPFWPLMLLGIALCALFGRPVVAIALGLLCDIAYGTPLGVWHVLYFPFTLFAVVGVILHYFFAGHLRKNPQDIL